MVVIGWWFLHADVVVTAAVFVVVVVGSTKVQNGRSEMLLDQ